MGRHRETGQGRGARECGACREAVQSDRVVVDLDLGQDRRWDVGDGSVFGRCPADAGIPQEGIVRVNPAFRREHGAEPNCGDGLALGVT